MLPVVRIGFCHCLPRRELEELPVTSWRPIPISLSISSGCSRITTTSMTMVLWDVFLQPFVLVSCAGVLSIVLAGCTVPPAKASASLVVLRALPVGKPVCASCVVVAAPGFERGWCHWSCEKSELESPKGPGIRGCLYLCFLPSNEVMALTWGFHHGSQVGKLIAMRCCHSRD